METFTLVGFAGAMLFFAALVFGDRSGRDR